MWQGATVIHAWYGSTVTLNRMSIFNMPKYSQQQRCIARFIFMVYPIWPTSCSACARAAQADPFLCSTPHPSNYTMINPISGSLPSLNTHALPFVFLLVILIQRRIQPRYLAQNTEINSKRPFLRIWKD